MSDKQEAPIIVKKGKKCKKGGGGAWEIAYGDFVTSMMALFIVLWVLGQSEEIKKAVGGYFRDPVGFTAGGGTKVQIVKGNPSKTIAPDIMNAIEKKHKEANEANIPYQYDDACRNLPAELVIDNTNPFTIRITRPNATIHIKDYIHGDLNFEPNMIDSFVIMHQDKTPTYNFASAVDDMLNDISIVIRSEEHIDNTVKQDHIRASLQYDKKIEYAHLPIILNDNGEKMGKHENISNIKWLLEEGYLPEAIANYLLTMGNKTPQEIFSTKEAIKWFNLQSISKSPTHFSIDVLKRINQEHLKALDAKELSRYVGFADEEIGELARIYLKKVATTKELKAKIAPIFEPRVIPKEFKESSELIVNAIKSAPFFEEYDDFKNHIMKETGLKGENYSKTIRLLLTNTEHGPDLAEVYKYIKNYLGEIIK